VAISRCARWACRNNRPVMLSDEIARVYNSASNFGTIATGLRYVMEPFRRNEMSISRKSIASGTGTLALVVGLTMAQSAVAQETCPMYRSIQHIHMVDNMSAVVATPRANYRVVFANICQVHERGEYFVLDRFQLGQCLSAGDTFDSSGTAAPCRVESVTQLRDLMPSEGE